LKNGILRFENLEMKWGRHSRLIVQSDFDENSLFSNMTGLEVLHTEQDNSGGSGRSQEAPILNVCSVKTPIFKQQ